MLPKEEPATGEKQEDQLPAVQDEADQKDLDDWEELK
jgi:hypothetical protein